jgi:CRP/FNR family transcriptional regulator, dissimilatory nitrate respiration regulator
MIAIMFDDLEPLLQDLAGRELAVDQDELVFRQGDPVRQLFFVTAGAVHLVRHQESGAPIVLQRAGPGAILAEASLYSETYHCDAVAVAQSHLWAVAKPALLARMAQRPELAAALIRRFAHELQNARFHAELLAMKTVAARLDAWLGWRGALPPKGDRLRLAAELGVSPEALYREIARRR